MSKKPATEFQNEFALTWEEIKPCTYKVLCALPKTAVNDLYKAVTKSAMQHANVPGFRPGTAPEALVLARYKDAINDDVVERAVRAAFDKMTGTEEHKVIGYVLKHDENFSIPRDADVTIEFEASVAPTFTLPDYKGVKVDVERTVIDDAAVNRRLEALRFSYGEFKTIEEPLCSADLAQVSYHADLILEDDAPSKLKALCNADKSWVWVEREGRIPGMDGALMGKKTGDKVTFDATFPEDFSEPLLAGKTIKYDVEVFETQRRIGLEDDVELCKKVCVDNMDALREQIRKDLENEAKAQDEQKIGEAVKSKILADTETFEMPEAFIEKQAEQAFREIAGEIIKSDADVPAFNAARAEHEENAKKQGVERARERFIINAIARKENITVEEEEFMEQIAGMAQYFGMSEEEMLKRVGERHAEEEISERLLTRKVMAFLAENSAK